VAGSARSDFPTDLERLVLQVGTNHATIALREARLITQLRRAAERLEARVAERTSELTAANDALRQEAAERRRGERTLAETEARLEQMAEAVPEVIWIAALEPAERVVYCNPSFERVWGLPLAELYRNPRLWTEAIHPEDRARVETAYARWIAGTGIDYQDVDFRIVRPDGSLRWIHEHGVLARNEQGRPIRASGISTDVTERKEAEGELARAFDEIRELKDRLQQENIALREEVEKTSMFEEVVGISEPIRAVLTQVARVAPTDTTILVSGETGTGKELVARAIHKLSRRSNRALICVNCAAIPPVAHRLGAVRARKGSLHRRVAAPTGSLRTGGRRDDLPRRGRRASRRDTDGAPPRAPGAGVRARGRRRPAHPNRRSRDCRFESRSGSGGLPGCLPRGSLLPSERLPDRDPSPPRAPGGHRRPRRVLHHRYARRAGRRIRGLHEAALELLRSYDWPATSGSCRTSSSAP
jgi:PAS domain S-box-containing protein